MLVMNQDRRDDDYDNFYLEIPQVDYPKDIEIQDEYDTSSDEARGLSAEQVSKLALDSLEHDRPIRRHGRNRPSSEQRD